MAGAGTTARTLTAINESQSAEASRNQALVLRLQPTATVTWANDVVDNEGMNKRSSKAC